MLDLLDNKLWLHFVRYPMEQSHIRELGKKIRLSPTTILVLLKELKKLDLLTTKKQGKNLIVSSNYENPDFIFNKKWSNLMLLLDSGLIGEIRATGETIVLFGSFSRGEDTEKSDIDLAVSELPDLDTTDYEKYLSRRIQFHRIRDARTGLLENIRQGILIEGVMP